MTDSISRTTNNPAYLDAQTRETTSSNTVDGTQATTMPTDMALLQQIPMAPAASPGEHSPHQLPLLPRSAGARALGNDLLGAGARLGSAPVVQFGMLFQIMASFDKANIRNMLNKTDTNQALTRVNLDKANSTLKQIEAERSQAIMKLVTQVLAVTVTGAMGFKSGSSNLTEATKGALTGMSFAVSGAVGAAGDAIDKNFGFGKLADDEKIAQAYLNVESNQLESQAEWQGEQARSYEDYARNLQQLISGFIEKRDQTMGKITA